MEFVLGVVIGAVATHLLNIYYDTREDKRRR